MGDNMNLMMSIFLSILVVSLACAEDTWTLTKPGTFGRDAKAIAEVVGDEVKVTFEGKQDWALHGMGRIPVKSWAVSYTHLTLPTTERV